jgi:hypothetical protein
MIKLVLAIALLLTSCSPAGQMIKLPSLDNAWQIQTGVFPSPNDVSKIVDTFYNHWLFEFGDPDYKVLNTLNSLVIEWREKPKKARARSITGRLTTGLVRGITLSRSYVWVWVGKNRRVSSTALVHELVHSALWSANGHPDIDHEGGEYKGWTVKHTEFIYKINYLLADRGL